jgi:hypothetical protein
MEIHVISWKFTSFHVSVGFSDQLSIKSGRRRKAGGAKYGFLGPSATALLLGLRPKPKKSGQGCLKTGNINEKVEIIYCDSFTAVSVNVIGRRRRVAMA